jgi:hypothetical protein
MELRGQECAGRKLDSGNSVADFELHKMQGIYSPTEGLTSSNERLRASRIGKFLCGLWSEFLATDPEVWVRFPALPDFLKNSWYGTGSTQPREYN